MDLSVNALYFLAQRTLMIYVQVLEGCMKKGKIFFIASGLHPIHGWPSAQLELQFLNNFSDKSDEFKVFLSVPHTNKDIAERFDIDQSAASLFLYRLEKIGVVSTKKIGRFKGYVWKSDKINRQALVSEFGQLFNYSIKEKSVWDVRIKEAISKEIDDNPEVERAARQLFSEIIVACSRGESPRDAKERLLDRFSGEFKSKVDIRIWQLQVRSMKGIS
ncbi:MAG: hypothetical protein IAE98_11450 [Candidatus Kapabacteria bacterium]|nr:hypothetical protein [Candidatus Kapabacteria bacterium]